MELNEYATLARKFNNRGSGAHVCQVHALGLAAEVTELFELTNYIGVGDENPAGVESVIEELGDVMWNLHMTMRSVCHSGIQYYVLTVSQEKLFRDYGDLTREDTTAAMVVAVGRFANALERSVRYWRTEKERSADWLAMDSLLTELLGLLMWCIRLHGVSLESIAAHNIARLTKRYAELGIPLNEI